MINEQFLLTNARMFLEAYNRCCSHKKQGGVPYSFLAIPSVVNLSFALELYTKFLLHKEGQDLNSKKFRNHKIHTLFKELHNDTIKIISKHTLPYWPFSFEDFLYQHSEIFDKWRYSHEEKKQGLG